MFDVEGQTHTIIKRFRLELIFIGVALIIPIISFLILASESMGNESPPEIEFKSSRETIHEKKIFIDISGAINNPDVYEVPKDTRLGQLIELAGGISEEADESYFSKSFNKAKILIDQEKIYIPTPDEVSAGLVTANQLVSAVAGPSSTPSNKLISINEASTKDLESLPGIGVTTANKIADNRPYSTIDDLLTKKVVSSSVFTKIKALITL